MINLEADFLDYVLGIYPFLLQVRRMLPSPSIDISSGSERGEIEILSNVDLNQEKFTEGNDAFVIYPIKEARTTADFPLATETSEVREYVQSERVTAKETEAQYLDANDITANSVDYVLAKTGEAYAVHLPTSANGTRTIDLPNDNYSVEWFDPRNGGNSLNGSVDRLQGGDNILFDNVPKDPGKDWTVLVKLVSGANNAIPVAAMATKDSPHPNDPIKMSEHHNLHALLPESQATHVATSSGSWFDSTSWESGEIPGNGAKVLIPEGVTVVYDGQSDARLKVLRVDGEIEFATDVDTEMVLDTFIVADGGILTMGSASQPIQADNTATVRFTSDTPIDTAWDPSQLSRGLVTHGTVRIFGSDKLDFVSLAQDARAGDRELVLDLPSGMTSPQGWQVGDRLVLGGTEFKGGGSNEDNSRFQDEVLIISEINGNRISFTNEDITRGDNTVLRFDHERPVGYDNLGLYVANTSRNVVFETEDGENTPIRQRGHVMFMHNPDVQVNNAGFYHLGRSNKNILVDDVGENVDGSVGNGTNPRGRYSLHFHRMGAGDPNSTPAIARGNAVVDSPGWGIVHHDSHATIEDNVVFDVLGSGIVAESGNEIGAWRNNITIKTTGDQRGSNDFGENGDRSRNFDFGFNGEGYWVQGAAQIDIEDNVAVSAERDGITFFGGAGWFAAEDVRDAQTIPVSNLSEEWSEIAKGSEDESVVDVSAVPLRKFSGFESYNSSQGIGIWARVRSVEDGQLYLAQEALNERAGAHEFYSQVEDFQLWEMRTRGVEVRYSTLIEFQDGLILGNDGAGQGIILNDAVREQRFDNLHVEGFEVALSAPLDSDVNFVESSLSNSSFANNELIFNAVNLPNTSRDDFSAYFQIDPDNDFSHTSNNQAPTASFTTLALGGLAVAFDGNSSRDGDSSLVSLDSQGIVAYGWDFDNDGAIDQHGRQVKQIFASSGSKTVTLTVWDEQGASDTVTQTVEVETTPYINAFSYSGFEAGSVAAGFKGNSLYADKGWYGNRVEMISDSQAGNVLRLSGPFRTEAGQIVYNEGVHRGFQILSLDLKNTEGSLNQFGTNEIRLNLWGVNGEFDNDIDSFSGPFQAGILPMERTLLLNQSLGDTEFDWTTFEWEVDLGSGYDFLVFEIQAQKVNSGGDVVMFDNVALMGKDDRSPTFPSEFDLKIEAEDYDAYFDTTAPNLGGAYRNDGVDIEATRDLSGGYNVGYIQNGEWLEYKVSVPEAGSYNLDLRLAARGSDTYVLSANDQIVEFSGTGGFQNWTTISADPLLLSEGENTIRITALSDRFNINYLQLSLGQSDSEVSSLESSTPQQQLPNPIAPTDTPELYSAWDIDA